MVDYRAETNKISTRNLKGQKLKDYIAKNAYGYTPAPYVSPEKRIMNAVIELYKVNNLKPEEIICSLGMLLGTAIKALGIDSKTIKGENHTITVKVQKNDEQS